VERDIEIWQASDRLGRFMVEVRDVSKSLAVVHE
jgi:hypothetical protein